MSSIAGVIISLICDCCVEKLLVTTFNFLPHEQTALWIISNWNRVRPPACWLSNALIRCHCPTLFVHCSSVWPSVGPKRGGSWQLVSRKYSTGNWTMWVRCQPARLQPHRSLMNQTSLDGRSSARNGTGSGGSQQQQQQQTPRRLTRCSQHHRRMSVIDRVTSKMHSSFLTVTVLVPNSRDGP